MSIKRTNNVTLPFAVVNGMVSPDVTSTEEYRTLKAERDGLSQRVTDLIAENAALRSKTADLRTQSAPKPAGRRTGADTNDPTKPPAIPAGYRYVGFRLPRKGETFESGSGVFDVATRDFTLSHCHIIEKRPTPKLSRLDMQVLGMSKQERHAQYAKQGGKHPDDATDVWLPELPGGFRLESKTPRLHNYRGSISTQYYWIEPRRVDYDGWIRGDAGGYISHEPVYVALPKA